jgi:DNA-directed RNA polymerase specialized sigma24 family protein
MTTMDTSPGPYAVPEFPTTRWQRVLQAGAPRAPEARDALAELCGAYWFPIYAFIRRKGHGPEEAADLTQGFFARLLERGTIGKADPSRGRFRTFLLADCQHFLADRRDHDRARRRGGGRLLLSFDARDAEGRLAREPVDERTPERLFQQDWAVSLLGRVLELLRQEYRAGGREATFDALKGVLTDAPRASPSTGLAARLGTTAGAARSATHRLRRRYREILLEQIGATVDDEATVEEELGDLFDALRA